MVAADLCPATLPGGFNQIECTLFLAMVTAGIQNYFEWGAGSSTLLAAKRAQSVTSVEGSRVWADKVRNGSLPSNVNLRYVDIGPTKAFSWPIQTNTTRSREYIRAIDAVPPQDVVLVDGRWRVACALRARHRLTAPNGVVLVHDFDRREYQVLLGPFRQVARKGNLVALRPREGVHHVSKAYETDPSR